MRIGTFDTAQRVLVVAEVGNNHEGRFDTAAELVRRAADAGADAVKFQTFRTEAFVDAADARFARLKSFELSIEQFSRLADLARSVGLLFISTPLDLGSAAAIERLVNAYKIASGDITFHPLIAAVARTQKPMILSSGASTLEEIRAALTVAGRSAGALLHCVSSYPTPEFEANLGAIPLLASSFDLTIGYSDHVVGIDASVAAVAAGARIIEKHFTLAHDFSDFRDHQLSATPPEMAELVARVRRTEVLLGSGEKRLQACEAPARNAIRRSTVVVGDRPRGHVLAVQDLQWLRPGGGMAPGEETGLIGRALRRDVQKGHRLQRSDVDEPAG